MEKYIKIGDFAKLNQTTIQTLRYYNEIGLLCPAYIDDESNYRYYTIHQSVIVDVIQYLQTLNFSLKEIKRILDNNHPDQLIKQINSRKGELLNQQKIIEQKLKHIDLFEQDCLSVLENMDDPEPKLEVINQRYAYTYPIHQNIYTMSLEQYEYHLRSFKTHLLNQGFSLFDFSRICTFMSKEEFQKEVPYSDTLFIFTDQIKSNKTFKKYTYFSLYTYGFENELDNIKKMNKVLTEKNLVPIDDYICEVLYEIPTTTTISRPMYLRLQIPIQ